MVYCTCKCAHPFSRHHNIHTTYTMYCYLSLLLFLFCLSAPSLTTFASCPSAGCGPYGSCIMETRNCGSNCTDRCVCQDGYDGYDCSFRVEICAGSVGPNNVMTCLNGGTCYQSNSSEGGYNQNHMQYRCDCQNAYGRSGIIFAGFQW
jgi:hypothetical protein